MNKLQRKHRFTIVSHSSEVGFRGIWGVPTNGRPFRGHFNHEIALIIHLHSYKHRCSLMLKQFSPHKDKPLTTKKFCTILAICYIIHIFFGHPPNKQQSSVFLQLSNRQDDQTISSLFPRSPHLQPAPNY